MFHEKYAHEWADADALTLRAEELRREREELLDRARELRADRRQRPLTLARIADETGIALGKLTEAAKRMKLETRGRAGGAERGEIVSTIAMVEAWLSRQPVRSSAAKAAPENDVETAAVIAIDRAVKRGGGRR